MGSISYEQALDSARSRLEKQTDRSDENGCWPWTGPIASTGYGMIGLAAAARERGLPAVPTAPWVACFLASGPPKDGQHCLHSCGNRRCCNPAHLRWGTAAENMQDRVREGRSPTQKLTPEQVLSIRQRMAAVPWGQRGAEYAAISDETGVSENNIRKIVNGSAWSWCEGATTRGQGKGVRGKRRATNR